MLADYNGWSGRDREKAERIYKSAVRTGEIPSHPRSMCDMCGIEGPEGIMLHCEEYGPTMFDYLNSMKPLCCRCHGMAHVRFRFPGIWTRYLSRLDRGKTFPKLANIVILFSETRHWEDIPPVKIRGIRWYHKLPLERYSGPAKRIASKERAA